jgi:uncharacterized protein (UPF0333 family)
VKKLLVLIIHGMVVAGSIYGDNANQTPGVGVSHSRTQNGSTDDINNQNLKYHDKTSTIMPRYDRGLWGNDYSLRRDFLYLNNIKGK